MKRFRLAGEEIEPESVSMANVLMLLSRSAAGNGDETEQLPGRVFECKTCSRRFPSFQALGGHRASHKKPRLGDGAQSLAAAGAPAKPKVHECSICGLEFSIGQALGGHMRRHRPLTDGLAVKKTAGGGPAFCFDLNLLPSENETESRKMILGLVV